MGFFDLNENNVPIKEKVKVLKKREITEKEIIPQPTVQVKVLDADVGADNKIHHKEKIESLDETNPKSKYVKNLSHELKRSISTFGAHVKSSCFSSCSLSFDSCISEYPSVSFRYSNFSLLDSLIVSKIEINLFLRKIVYP